MPSRPVLPALAVMLATVGGCGSDYNRQRYGDAAGALAIAGLVCAVSSCRQYGPDYPILRGQVLEPHDMSPLPLGYVRVTLQQSGHEIAFATTDRSGRFAFTQDLANGSYDLVLDTGRHVGATRVELRGRTVTVEVLAAQK
jgi:hypothetical protein